MKTEGLLREPSIRGFTRGYAREAYYWVKQKVALRKVERRNPILVYQMGKVGSSTVVRTLHHLNLGVPVLHLHALAPELVRFAIRRQRRSLSPFLPEHLVASSYMEDKIASGTFPCRIITLTREPVARAISFVFEDRQKQVPEAIRPDGSIDVHRVAETVNRLLVSENGIADPTRWFDGELKACFGIDVFSQPYDFDRGYSIFSEQNVSALVIRLEDLNRALPVALADLLDVDPAWIQIDQANLGSQKWYANELASVKESLHLSEDTLRRVTGTRYFQHFYADETDRVWERWVEG